MCAFYINSMSQSILKEAEFIGDVRIVNADSTTTNLEKNNVGLITKATGSKIWWGIGSSRAFIKVPGKYSSSRFPEETKLQFIVRVADNNLDPMSVVSIFPFVIKGKDRRAEFGHVNNYLGNSSSGLKRLDYEAKKFGEHSYIITLTTIKPGEYGIIVNNPNLQRDDSNIIVYSFAIEGVLE